MYMRRDTLIFWYVMDVYVKNIFLSNIVGEASFLRNLTFCYSENIFFSITMSS
jgi:hypothetical protein